MSVCDSLEICGRRIGHEDPPYIVAELSANHGGDLERAKRIIRMAAKLGADAIKFQAYHAGNMTLDCDMPGFTVEADNPWKGRRLFELYASAATPYEWFPELFGEARAAGIVPFATPFGSDAVEMLEALNAPAYKIASFEAVDLELIAACGRTGKPMIISTGLCSEDEIGEALEAARTAGATEIGILKCSSAYPAKLEDANLLAILRLRETFGVPVGYSDHTIGTTAAIAACALGACMIEKHVIDAREPPTADSDFSALPDELEELVRLCRNAYAIRGNGRLERSEREEQSLVFRRSLYASADIPEGQSLDCSNVRSVRPGFGLAPKHLEDIVGRRTNRAVKKGEPLDWELLK